MLFERQLYVLLGMSAQKKPSLREHTSNTECFKIIEFVNTWTHRAYELQK